MDVKDRLKVKLEGEDISDAKAEDLLESAKYIIFANRFPNSKWPDTVEGRYLDLQVRIAVELYSREGAEGQTSHSENGISRSYSTASISPELLREITPIVGVVRKGGSNG